MSFDKSKVLYTENMRFYHILLLAGLMVRCSSKMLTVIVPTEVPGVDAPQEVTFKDPKCSGNPLGKRNVRLSTFYDECGTKLEV